MAGPSRYAALIRVLLVEDDPHDRAAVRRCLEKVSGFALTHCPGAAQVLDQSQDELTGQDVIVVDHGPPGLGGLELCRELLQIPRCPPLVVLTGSGSELLAVDCLKLGVADYLVKDPARDYLALLPLILQNVVRRHRERLGREQAERALVEEGLRRGILLDSLPVGVISLDADFTIQEINPVAEKLIGFDAAGCLGLPCDEVVVADCCGADCPLKFSLRSGRPVGPMDVTLYDRGRNAIPVSYTASGITDASGLPAGGVLVFQDVTALKALERERAATLSVTIHDLKAPLAGIKGLSRLLLDRRRQVDPDTRRAYLESIHAEAKRLSDLVDNHLESAREGRSGPRLELCRRDLAALLRDLADSYKDKFRREGKTLEARVPDGPLDLDLDPPRIRRALANLLDNAARYGGGPAELRLDLDDYDIRVQVADRGPGIPEQALPHVFKPFFRADGSGGKAGFGLGLAGVKAIVEGHGGGVSVRNRPGGGCVFTVKLPRPLEQPGP